MTSIRQIHEAITRMGIEGSSIVVHSSLRSFGKLEGGTAGLIAVLQERFGNVVMPAFSTTFITRPPIDDRPEQNGCDYDDPEAWKLNAEAPFDFEKVEVDRRMGRIALDFSRTPGVFRSRHPWHGWAVSGNQARDWTESHPWDQTHPPLKKLIEADGWVILMGVDLRSCTAIHLAEEAAGRKPFIRWARNEAGGVSRIRVSGCAKGFNGIEPDLRGIQKVRVGESEWRWARIQGLVEESRKKILSHSPLTCCSPDCIRCRDAILGGPQDGLELKKRVDGINPRREES